MNRVLYLYASTSGETVFFAKERQKTEGVDCVPLYKNKGIINKLILGLGYYIFSPLLYLLYGPWKKDIDKYDYIILPSRRPAKYAVKFLSRKSGKKVIVYYWNTVTNEELAPEWCKKHCGEVWSFDKDDCEKYGLKYADTYYFDLTDDSGREPEHDIFYVGVDKVGRKELLHDLNDICEKNNLSFDCHLVKNVNYSDENSADYQFSPRLDYFEVLDNIKNSRSILDLTLPYQAGLTLRPLEALAFRKKLITNNQAIVNSRAYDAANTFIIKDDKLDGLDEFLKKPYQESEEDLFEFYRFETWLNRIENGIEAY